MVEIVNAQRLLQSMAPGRSMIDMTADTDYSSNDIRFVMIGAGTGAVSLDTKGGDTVVIDSVTANTYIWCGVTGWNSSGSDVTQVIGFTG